MKMASVFLDIDIGDADKHAAEMAGAGRGQPHGRVPCCGLLQPRPSWLFPGYVALYSLGTRAEWERACAFLAGSGANYGLSGATPSELDDAGKELLLEVYGSDPAAADGPIRTELPASLRCAAARQSRVWCGARTLQL